jgi:ABC-type glutathione transport system ATPase component
LLEVAMAIIYKSIRGCERRRRAAAAARGEPRLSPDDSWPDGLAAIKAVSREPATQVQEEAVQVSRSVVIEVRGLRKSYDGLDAVAGIDLEVRAGEVFAFLGPNGAGKTTTVEILEGYRRRTAGASRRAALR